MKITVNGKAEEIAVRNLSELLQSKNIEPRMVSIEINETSVARTAYDQTILKDGDQIEFLYFMGGGTDGCQR
ncbi:MAG: sulfur carrier protein ThiS [Nitrospirota bacterium]